MAVRQRRETPPQATVGLWHVESAGGDSAVLKVLRAGTTLDSRWPATPEPTDPYYWRREALAYPSGLLAPFGAPACRAVVERADGSVALWLDAVPEAPAWTPALLGAVARRVGMAQAAPAPELPWLAHDWLREYLGLHGVTGGEDVLRRLDALPQTLCLHDLHPANVLGANGEYVVDWAYCGSGARGQDAGVLVADGVADGAFPAELGDEVADAVWAGYLDGLRAAGWSGDEDAVRFAFAHGTALRLSWLPRGRRPTWDAAIELLQRLTSGA